MKKEHSVTRRQIKIDERTKRYFKLLTKNKRLFEKLLKNKKIKETGQRVAFCLTELYFNSQSVIKLIDKISQTKRNFNKNDLDSLLGNMIDLQTEIYIEMTDYIKELRKPLKNVIDKVGNLRGDKSTNIARKIIRSSMKRCYIILKRIKYYPAHNKPKRKSQG
jgi:hypothetical protein